MSPIVVTLIVIAFIALLVVQQVVFERNLQRARQNRTGIFRYSPHVRRIIVVAVIAAAIPLIDLAVAARPLTRCHGVARGARR